MLKLFQSDLYNEKTFYKAFLRDLENCRQEVIIESPYITSLRMETFYPIFERILDRGIKIHIITRDLLNTMKSIGIKLRKKSYSVLNWV